MVTVIQLTLSWLLIARTGIPIARRLRVSALEPPSRGRIAGDGDASPKQAAPPRQHPPAGQDLDHPAPLLGEQTSKMPNHFLLLTDSLLGPIGSPVRNRQLLAERFDRPRELLCRRDDSRSVVIGDSHRVCRPAAGDIGSMSGTTLFSLDFAVLTRAENGTVTRGTPSLPTCRPQRCRWARRFADDGDMPVTAASSVMRRPPSPTARTMSEPIGSPYEARTYAERTSR